MRRRIVWVVIGLPLALIVLGAGTALAWPTTRHMISGLWNLPDRLPALPADGQVHYQPGAEDFARDVAALLPDAIGRIEGVHSRHFAHPVTVGVYATPEACAAANGVGSAIPVGVTFAGRVNLSPKLFRSQQQRKTGIRRWRWPSTGRNLVISRGSPATAPQGMLQETRIYHNISNNLGFRHANTVAKCDTAIMVSQD